MTVATSVKLSDETGAKLERLAARTGRSKSYYLREAVETHIDQLVRDYEILDTAQNVRAGRERTYSLAEVEDILDLGD
ncbi:ribbon-helix-helix protein, CopG family [Kocuria rhizophila]|uniref:Ribbon-helix-helix protein, CopG family n=1 Tax=Kocuria rhizophila TaxID=72000 RepID=A0AAX2SAL9_KOCRH|nr:MULTISPECIES: ribbon-helix-helix protein, CopG family [Kocuria]MXN61332.1 ribbon-helix-helix protein, CopG family [Bacillus sp. BGMRC0062]MCR4526669.1 ribbon-helix-helix protein, CopG family [Kocuria rhizophila]MCT1457302.1 ribbon-helix-helix protein, CopG family [Kocuria rhizophila]MCT1545311.1 ribbon-helix-helix protein, CopG family [Kocuria rhizophila]MCT1879318.1 ribbon-helix-helix protein, CopG family [Kocuria rhizophila]